MAGSMNWTRRRYEIAAVVPVVAVFVALHVWSPPDRKSKQVGGGVRAHCGAVRVADNARLVYRRPARPSSARRHGGLAATIVRQPSLPAPAGDV